MPKKTSKKALSPVSRNGSSSEVEESQVKTRKDKFKSTKSKNKKKQVTKEREEEEEGEVAVEQMETETNHAETNEGGKKESNNTKKKGKGVVRRIYTDEDLTNLDSPEVKDAIYHRSLRAKNAIIRKIESLKTLGTNALCLIQDRNRNYVRFNGSCLFEDALEISFTTSRDVARAKKNVYLIRKRVFNLRDIMTSLIRTCQKRKKELDSEGNPKNPKKGENTLNVVNVQIDSDSDDAESITEGASDVSISSSGGDDDDDDGYSSSD